MLRPALICTACVLLIAVLLAAAAFGGIEAEKTEPADGETLDRPVRSLRVWFNVEPEVEKSELVLEGPEGQLNLQGLHTMGDKDLMIRVVGRVPDGEYKARWMTVGADGEVAEGEWGFTIKRGG